MLAYKFVAERTFTLYIYQFARSKFRYLVSIKLHHFCFEMESLSYDITHVLKVGMKPIMLLIIFVDTFFYLTSINWRWHRIIKSAIYTYIVCLGLLFLFLLSHWTIITSFREAQFIIRSVSNATTFHMILLILTVTGWITRLTLIDQQIGRWRGWCITPITVSCRRIYLTIMMFKRRIRIRYQMRFKAILETKQKRNIST